MTFFGVIGISALVIMAIFKQKPTSSATVKKRKIPAERSVFVTALSPLDSALAKKITDVICDDIGKDSSVTKMIVGGTKVYKHSTSLADFRERVQEALRYAQKENLRTQGVLLSQTASQLFTDMLPWKVYVIGAIAEGTDKTAIFRIRGFASATEKRHNNFAPVQVYSYLFGNDSVATVFKNSLYNRTFSYDTLLLQGI